MYPLPNHRARTRLDIPSSCCVADVCSACFKAVKRPCTEQFYEQKQLLFKVFFLEVRWFV